MNQSRWFQIVVTNISISHHHRQRKSILSLSFLFFPTQALFRVDTKRNASVQDSEQVLFVHHRIRSDRLQASIFIIVQNIAKSSPPWCVVGGGRRRVRETQRARAQRKKREIQKKQRERPPEPRKKREKRLARFYNIITLVVVFRNVLIRSDLTHPSSSLEDIRAHTFFYFMRVCVFCSVTIPRNMLFLSCIFCFFFVFFG